MQFPRILRAALLAGVLCAGACKDQKPQPLYYDPPGSTITTDKEINLQERRTFAFPEAGLWASNAFAGGRLNDLQQVNDSVFTAVILPENAPINNSAWYAFKLWARAPKTILLELTYRDGSHRYVPKLSHDGATWSPIAAGAYAPDTSSGTAMMRLSLGPDTLWVAGQELITLAQFQTFANEIARLPYVEKSEIGRSKMGRPLLQLRLTEAASPRDYVLLISRQHPPEVTGSIALMQFIRTLVAETELAHRFRQKFCVLAVPLMNPDGVDEGHWRHNAAGIDLNRDWFQFNQPETRAVRDTFLKIKQQPGGRVVFCMDFHSTQEDVFYTLAKDLETTPPGFLDEWLARIAAANPDYRMNEDPSGLGTPVSKNWFYETFGAPALTYEVGDEGDRALIRRIAASSAEALMALLLEQIN